MLNYLRVVPIKLLQALLGIYISGNMIIRWSDGYYVDLFDTT